jgi:hypothetical protein
MPRDSGARSGARLKGEGPNNLIWGTQKENMNYPGFKAAAAARLREYSLARMPQTRM